MRRIKESQPQWDREGLYAEKSVELARECGVPSAEIYEEFAARTATRFYDAGFNVDEAETLAWFDTLERFARR